MKERLLTIDEVAWSLRLSRMTIYRMIHRGELRAAKIANQWRIPAEAIDKWLTESFPSRKLLLPTSSREMGSRWEERYGSAHHKFVRDIINTKPDIFALMDRREARLFTEIEEVSSGYEGLICYCQLFECMPDTDIEGKYIALLDDSIQHGTTLHKKREDLVNRGAVVRTFAFMAPEAFLSNDRMTEEPGAQVCVRLDNSEFTRSCAQLTDFLLEQGRTQDTDHFMLFLTMRGKDGSAELEQFLESLNRLGNIFIVPSPAEKNGIITVTLDHPDFFSFDLNDLGIDLDFEDGVVKFKFFYHLNNNLCGGLALAMPRVKLNVNTYFDVEGRDIRLPINLKKMGLPYAQLSEEQKALSCYRDISLNLSLIMFEQLLRRLNCKDSPCQVWLVEPFVIRDELQLSYGRDLGNKLSERIVQRLSGCAKIKGSISDQATIFDEQNQRFLPFISENYIQKRQLQAMFDIMPVSKLLVKEYEEYPEPQKMIRDKREHAQEHGLTFSEICQRLAPSMQQWQVSFALDLGLERTVIAPVYLKEPQGHGDWIFRKGYRAGEAAPGEPPDQIGHGTSKALDSVVYHFRRDKFLVPFVLAGLMEYCSTQTNGVESFLLAKVMACLVLDWLKKIEHGWSSWEATPQEFGPLPEIPRSIFEGGGNLYELAHNEAAFFEFKSATRRFLPIKGWDKVVLDFYSEDDLASIDAYVKLYSTIFNRLDSGEKRPAVDTLLTLSACFNEESTYTYAHRNLSLWEERFGRFIDLCRQKLARGGKDYLKKRIPESIIGAERAALLAYEDKISKYERLSNTRRELKQVLENQTNPVLLKVGSGILNRIKPQESLSSRLVTLRQVAMLMKDISTMTKFMFSRAKEFNIPGKPASKEQGNNLSSYQVRVGEKSKGLINVEQCRALFEINDEDLNFAALHDLLKSLDTLYQEVCQCFHNNCPEPEPVSEIDPFEILNSVIPIEQWFRKHALSNGVIMLTKLKKSDLIELSTAEVERMVQWHNSQVEDIVIKFEGEVKRSQEDNKLIAFKHAKNAAIAAVTILHEASELLQDSSILPIGIGLCKVAYSKDSKSKIEFQSKVNWVRKIAELIPAGLYVTEDILGTMNELGIKCSVPAVAKTFDSLGQKVCKVHWDLIEPKLLTNSGRPLLHVNVLRNLEELAPMKTLPLLNIYSKEERSAGSDLGQFRFLLIPHFLPDLFGFLCAIARVGGYSEDICLVHKPYPYKSFNETKKSLIELGYKVFPLQQKEQALEYVISQTRQDGKQIIAVEDGGYITPLIHTMYSEEIGFFRGIVEQTTKGVDRVKAQIRKVKLPYRIVAESRIKTEFEPPAVAEAAVRNIRQMLPNKHFSGHVSLVIGYGNIGKPLAFKLRDDEKMTVCVHDRKEFKLAAAAKDNFITDDHLPNLIEKAWLILGATGDMSIGENEIFHLQNDSVLVSVSSDQEEISPQVLAKFSQKTPKKVNSLSTEYVLEKHGAKVLLLGDGFPINFVVAEGIPNEIIDLVLTEIYLNVIDLACGQKPLKKGWDVNRVNELSEERKVIERWRGIHYA